MNIKKLSKYIALIMFAVVLTACPSKPKLDGEDGDVQVNDTSNSETGYTNPYNDPKYGQRGTEDRVIYFDYDSDALRAESHYVVAAHAKALSATPSRGLLLEGHTDARGSREYNIGLGERRARSVQQMMLSQGASANQIKIMSYGKERPAVSGDDSGAYAQNRRVEIVY